MKRIRIIGLALAALFAFSAISAAAAQAELPEFSIPGAFPKEFRSTGSAVKLETKAGRTVKCEASKFEGEWRNLKEFGKVRVTLTGCKANAPFGEAPCKTAGKKAGEIVTNSLTAKLRYISKASDEVGLAFGPEAKEGIFAEFKCEGGFVNETEKVRGSVIGRITPLNVATPTFKIEFAQEKGVQKYTEYEEGGKKVPGFLEMKGEGSEAFGFEQAGEQGAETLKLVTNELWELKG